MSELRKVIEEAITLGLGEAKSEWISGNNIPDSYLATKAADRVWDALEDRIGTVQEKLLDDVQRARTELEAARRREEALAHTVAAQNVMIANYEDAIRSGKADPSQGGSSGGVPDGK